MTSLHLQDVPPAEIVALSKTLRSRFKVRVAAFVARRPQPILFSDPARLADRLSGDVLLLKGAPVLRKRAVASLAAALGGSVQAVYADEDRIIGKGLGCPFFKPDWSPILGRQHDYVGNVALFRFVFFLQMVLPDLGRDGLPSWIGDSGMNRNSVVHLPDILHSEPSSRRTVHVTGEAFDRALAQSARACGLPSVDVIIPTRDHAELLRSCVDSIFTTTDYDLRRLKVVIVDNGSTEASALELLEELRARPSVTVLERPEPFNYARLCNQGAAAASGDLLVFANNDITIRDRDWLLKLAGATALPSAGVVGCKLLYPSGKIQHAGIVLGIQGLAGHLGIGTDEDHGTYFNIANQTREISAVTGALTAVRRTIFHAAGNYDETLVVAFNDVALCLACNRLGYQTLYLQSAIAYHLESATRGHDDHDPVKRARLLRECRNVLSKYDGFKCDPFYNLNLSLIRPYETACPPRHVANPPRKDLRSPRVLMLSSTFQIGHGVAVVVEILARTLERSGCKVFIGSPKQARELPWPAERRVIVSDAGTAAVLAVQMDIDVVMVHTPPFFATFKVLPFRIAALAYDHGEPPVKLFSDAPGRRIINADKLMSFHYADRVLAISEVVRRESEMPGCGLLPLGNTHLVRWTGRSVEKRQSTRAVRGWNGQLVILNVCRFRDSERIYKGVDTFIALRRALDLLHPQIGAMTRFVLAGKALRPDVRAMVAAGLDVIANPTDEMLGDLYHAADLYTNFSQWEGFNLGIAQALALGLPVLASDIAAHRAFGVNIMSSLADAVDEVVRLFNNPSRNEVPPCRQPRLYDWEESGRLLRAEIDALLERKHDRASGEPKRDAVPVAEPETAEALA